MQILIVNDDGIYSPGILALARAAREFGDVRIVAPDMERSSMGHAVTHNRPLSYRRTPLSDFEAYRVDGTPADCVAVGFSIWGSADVVLSGLNLGLNLGNSTWHSGTLAGAKQAALMGSRGIALSVPSNSVEAADLERLTPCVGEVLAFLLPKLEFGLINVNFPAAPVGLQWTKQSVRHYDGRVVPAQDPMGRQHYWFAVFPVEETEPGTDRWAVGHGYVSMTPLRLDLTDNAALEQALKSSPPSTGAGCGGPHGPR